MTTVVEMSDVLDALSSAVETLNETMEINEESEFTPSMVEHLRDLLEERLETLKDALADGPVTLVETVN